jgi:TRAP-type mannitol/chloroaromatic compound transport system substrate-binding protein
VPGNGVFDAVSEGTAQLYHAVPAYWGSKSKGILLFGSQPFGLRADEQFGWMIHGGGQALYDEMYGRFGIKPFLCGNSGPQWAGWFRNEINSVEDLKGLKFRTTGLASEMAPSLAWPPKPWAARRCSRRLQTGALDAGEFIGPWTDSALGFYQVAKNYYWPGVGEPSSAEECGVNAGLRLAELPDDLQTGRHARLREPLQPGLDRIHHQARPVAQDACVRAWRDGAQAARRCDRGHGWAAEEVIDELRQNDDELVKRITESFIAYRDLVGGYMTYADNGQMNARAGGHGLLIAMNRPARPVVSRRTFRREGTACCVWPTIDDESAGSRERVRWLALMMVLVQFAIVVGRYVFGVNIIAVQESVLYMHATPVHAGRGLYAAGRQACAGRRLLCQGNDLRPSAASISSAMSFC